MKLRKLCQFMKPIYENFANLWPIYEIEKPKQQRSKQRFVRVKFTERCRDRIITTFIEKKRQNFFSSTFNKKFKLLLVFDGKIKKRLRVAQSFRRQQAMSFLQ